MFLFSTLCSLHPQAVFHLLVTFAWLPKAKVYVLCLSGQCTTRGQGWGGEGTRQGRTGASMRVSTGLAATRYQVRLGIKDPFLQDTGCVSSCLSGQSSQGKRLCSCSLNFSRDLQGQEGQKPSTTSLSFL